MRDGAYDDAHGRTDASGGYAPALAGFHASAACRSFSDVLTVLTILCARTTEITSATERALDIVPKASRLDDYADELVLACVTSGSIALVAGMIADQAREARERLRTREVALVGEIVGERPAAAEPGPQRNFID